MLRRRTPALALGVAGLVSAIMLSGCSGHAAAPVAAPAAPSTVAMTVPSSASASEPAPADPSGSASASASDDSGVGFGAAVAQAFAAGPSADSATTATKLTKPTKPTRGTSGKRLAGLTIVLDPGHNGDNSSNPARLNAPVPAGGFYKACNTAGAETNAGYPEHAFTWDVVNRAARILAAEGATVVLTRHSDTGFGPCVDKRAAIGNAAHADAVVAVHADGAAAGQSGFHVIAPALAPDHGNRSILSDSWRLAVALHGAFHSATGEANANYVSGGLVRRSDLAGLNLSRVPAVFIECANMRNSADAAKVTSSAWRQQAAVGIVAGITEFLHR